MNRVVSRFNSLLNISLLNVLLNIVVGLLLVYYTEIASNVAMVIIGSLMIVHGLFCFINYFYDGIKTNFFKIDLIVGIISLLLGLVVVFNPIPTINLLGVGVGIWLLLNGCENLFYAFKFKKEGEEITPLVFFIAFISLVMGVSVMINPFSKFMLISKLIGLFIMADGIFNAVRIVLFKKRADNLLKMFE